MRNRPEGDIWEIKDNDAESQHYGKIFRFDFSFTASQSIKDLLKDYIWDNHRAGNRTLSTLYNYLNNFRTKFNKFAEQRNITSLANLNNNNMDDFLSFLHTSITNTKKPMSYKYQKACLDTLKSIIHWGQIHSPNAVPDTEIFTGNEYLGVNKRLKIDYIPDDMVQKINEALKEEENPYIRYGVIILQATGMRIGDLVNLTIDCIEPHLISGYTIKWFNHKSRKEKKSMPVRPECAVAVGKLLEYTKKLRELADEADKNCLFIYRERIYALDSGKNKVARVNVMNFIHCLKTFVRRNNILGTNGELYNLKTHQFRRTLGTDMLSKGISLNVIQEVLDHADPSITKRFYARVKDKERMETFRGIGIIGNINLLDASIFDNKDEMEWFEVNRNKGACMSDGYCTKPITEGKVCERLLKRQKCYTCSRYVTTPEFLDAHKNHLNSLERQISENLIYGGHYAEHFMPTIEVLKVIIERLEVLQSERKVSETYTN
jgi:integrase